MCLDLILTHGIFGFRPPVGIFAAVFICEVCHESFPTQTAVRQHLRTCVEVERELVVRVTTDAKKPLQQMRFESLSVEHLLATVKSAKGSSQVSSTEVCAPVTQELYLCSHRGCQIIFPTAVQLEFHMQEHKKDKRAFLCGNCGKCCLDRDDLADHVKSHIPIVPLTPVKCTMCGKMFANRARNLQHMRRHLTNISGVINQMRQFGMQENFLLRQTTKIARTAAQDQGRRL
jgi:hypothetical protein